MTDSPLVSVIIAVKNGERFLAEAIQSVLAQEYRPIEIIVVDGHSTDKTGQIAQSFADVRYVQQGNTGVSDAYNLGIETAQGELVAFLSHDDLWLVDKLSHQVEYMTQHPQVQYTITKMMFFLEPGLALPPGFKATLLTEAQIGRVMETLVAHKRLFSQIGTFNTGYSIASDVDWYARANDQQIPMALIPEVLVHKRVHDHNTSADAQTNNQQLLKILRRSVQRKREISDTRNYD
jgi:glycosyltransferase involved in cell wall biosynthesis